MTLDEAIKHAWEICKTSCGECAVQHEQLVNWLNELKLRRKIEKQAERNARLRNAAPEMYELLKKFDTSKIALSDLSIFITYIFTFCDEIKELLARIDGEEEAQS